MHRIAKAVYNFEKFVVILRLNSRWLYRQPHRGFVLNIGDFISQGVVALIFTFKLGRLENPRRYLTMAPAPVASSAPGRGSV